MSVQSNIAFFQGEDILLTLTMTPPTDITGWTLVSSVADEIGGTIWFNPTRGALQMWSGSAWAVITSGPPVTEVTLQGDATGTGP